MPFDFDAETAVIPLGDGRYSAGLDRSWWVQRGPNGGYLAAIVLRALTETVADPERTPRSLTVHYAAPPGDGASRSRRRSSARAARSPRVGPVRAGRAPRRARPGGVLEAAARARVQRPFGPGRPAARGVPAPGVRDARRVRPTGDRHPVGEPHRARWAAGHAHGRGAGGAVDPAPGGPRRRHLVASAITDAVIPAVFSRMGTQIVVPTVDLTVHFRAGLPAPGRAPTTGCTRSSRRARSPRASSRRTGRCGAATACCWRSRVSSRPCSRSRPDPRSAPGGAGSRRRGSRARRPRSPGS